MIHRPGYRVTAGVCNTHARKSVSTTRVEAVTRRNPVTDERVELLVAAIKDQLDAVALSDEAWADFARDHQVITWQFGQTDVQEP